MQSKGPACAMCPLHTRGTGFVPGYGTGLNGVMLLGEAPGQREAQTSRPFVGPAGAQLLKTLDRVGSSREDFRIENCGRCQPPNNWLDGAPWESGAVLNCSFYTAEAIKKYKPKVIVPLGNVALRYALGRSGIEDARGYVYRSVVEEHECFIVPTYHPSFLMRGAQNLTEVHAIDIRRALKVARRGYTEPFVDYIEHPDSASLARFTLEAERAAKTGAWLIADIETPTSGNIKEDEYGDITDAVILRISFSFRPGHAITITWNNNNFEAIQRIFSIPFKYVVFWNQGFDVPRLKARGIMFAGEVLDAMMMWHFLQSDLPKGLGYVATFFTEVAEWKSLSDRYPEFYSCKDADVTIQCAYRIRDILVEQQRFDTFVKHYVELHPKTKVMGDSGILIDMVQQDKFRGEIEKELEVIDNEIQSVVPREVRPFKARRKVEPSAYLGSPGGPSHAKGIWDVNSDGEWGLRYPFLYNSPKQVVAYMRSQDHPVPKNYKTGADTTSADEIEKLADQYPDDELYPRILGARGFRKIRGQYIDGYQPGPDGRVRTHFDRKPSTWRYNSEKPNVQNVLKRHKLATEYRKQFVAAPGHVLVEWDYKALESQLTGFYADDPQYVRASKLGVHAILMTHVMGNPVNLTLPTAEIKGILKPLKHDNFILYDACKHVVHMSNYGGSAKRIRIEFPDHFANVAEAKRIQDIYFSTIAKRVRRWQQSTLSRAFDQNFLQNVYGYRHYFYDALHYVGRGTLEWGTDAKRALAFLPQSTGAGLLSEALLRIWTRPEVFATLRWIIHDSIVAEIPIDKLHPYVRFIRECMEAPEPLLGGLSVEVEIQTGLNWGEMEDYNE